MVAKTINRDLAREQLVLDHGQSGGGRHGQAALRVPIRCEVIAAAGSSGLTASIIDMGNRFRLIINVVNLVQPEQPLPKLPVARAIWIPEPNLKLAATAWILAGGSHHTALSQALTAQHLQDFADITGMECLLVDANTDVSSFRKELKWNDIYYHSARGI